jgi:phosphate acetyltransferase
MFDKLIEKVKAEPKKIVFTEGSDARIQEAAARLLAEDLMGVVLVGNEE